jgi:hypothetical protein
MRKIYITGCAKSGTTMLNNLMTAFVERTVCPQEVFLQEMIPSKYDVGKRHWHFLFTKKIPYMDAYSCYMYLKKHDVLVLNINRNKEDVLASENGYVSEERYDACQEQKRIFGDIITLDVWFEEILDDPRGMQYTVAQYFGLDVDSAHDWREYPDFVPQEFWDHWKECGPRYGPRKLGEKV